MHKIKNYCLIASSTTWTGFYSFEINNYLDCGVKCLQSVAVQQALPRSILRTTGLRTQYNPFQVQYLMSLNVQDDTDSNVTWTEESPSTYQECLALILLFLI